MDLIDQKLPDVRKYLNQRPWHDVPEIQGHNFDVQPLAQGEYNLNYLISAGNLKFVLRVNIGTQIARPDQICYEYKTLKLLERSGVTPRPIFVDDSRQYLDQGVLIMEYLPGEPLDYQRDRMAAAQLFAVVHQIPVSEDQNHLIREDAPLSLIYDECYGLLRTYFESDLAQPAIRDYLQEVIQWAEAARAQEAFYQADPWPCIVNTEVNSGNFIVNRQRGSLHLVDWEMPRWGDPSQDLCHFCSPLTTLWKTDFRMTDEDKRAFMHAYTQQIEDRHLRDTLAERVKLRDPFVYLRGISWSAMGWVAYQTHFAGVKNPDTWRTLQQYMQLPFIRELFDPLMR